MKILWYLLWFTLEWQFYLTVPLQQGVSAKIIECHSERQSICSRGLRTNRNRARSVLSFVVIILIYELTYPNIGCISYLNYSIPFKTHSFTFSRLSCIYSYAELGSLSHNATLSVYTLSVCLIISLIYVLMALSTMMFSSSLL